jgi:S-adenosylmethionine hydrolase
MITLSSDFGWPYPAAMKGVLLQRTDARLVDVTHQFPRQDIRASAFWLREVLPFFPAAVHLVVVDPGVGTDRAAVVVRAGGHALVGPDNGVLLPVARRLARWTGGEKDGADGEDTASEGDTVDPGNVDVFRVGEQPPAGRDPDPGSDWPPVPASSTFHGRDVFAPAAAEVHRHGVGGLDSAPGFERVETFVDLQFPGATVGTDTATGEVLVVDGFGNAITNVPGRVAADRFGATMYVDGERAPVRDTYARVEPGQRLVTVGSHGNVELAVNRGRGDEAFDVDTGSPIEFSW